MRLSELLGSEVLDEQGRSAGRGRAPRPGRGGPPARGARAPQATRGAVTAGSPPVQVAVPQNEENFDTQSSTVRTPLSGSVAAATSSKAPVLARRVMRRSIPP